MIQFFKTKFPSFCSAGGKSALLTRLPHSLRHKNGKVFAQTRKRLKKWKKNLTPIVFPRKDLLARRVQFCKPCLRKFSRKWSWINQNTKMTNKICTIFTKKKLQENVAWTRKNNFDICDKVFRQELKRFFIQSPEVWNNSNYL